MHSLLEALKARGWTVETVASPQPTLPPDVARRYPDLPADLIRFISSIGLCCNAAQDAWFLTRDDYSRAPGVGFRWNEYEHMALEALRDDPVACAAVKAFWDSHFPFMMAVHSDYDYLAISLAASHFGRVVHGCAPEWEEPSVIAPSFEAFLQAFVIAATTTTPEYPLDVFL